MFFVLNTNEEIIKFENFKDLTEYIEIRHAEEGGFDWISEIKDMAGNFYGCTWKLEIDKI